MQGLSRRDFLKTHRRRGRGRCRRAWLPRAHPRARRGERQDRRAALPLRDHGHQRGVAPRRRADGGRGDQRQGRRDGQEDRACRRRPGFELGPVRREGQAAPAPGQGRRRVRLLDIGEPEVGTAGLREQQRPALLPGAVRGRGVLEERLLHGRDAQSAADPGRRVPHVQGRRRVQEVLPARHRLRVPAHGQQDPARVPARQGHPRRFHRRGVHAVQPSGLPDDRRQDQALQ